MQRKLLGAAAVLLAALPSLGQVTWTPVGATTDIRNPNAGMVGIGLNPWGGKLHVYSTTQHGIRADSDNPGSAGVAGIGNGTTTWGLSGIATHTTGSNIGVFGQTNSVNGTGIHAQFLSATGTGKALVADANSSDAFAIYSVGGKNYFDGSVGLGTTAPSAQLHTTSTVRHQGLATAKSGTTMLAADANGNVTKQVIPFANGVTEFMSVGTTSWSVPAGVSRVRVKLWGGGAAGDASTSGGSGAYVEAVLDVSSISSLSVTVGSGPTSSGGAGGNSTIANGGTTLVQAGGGGIGGTANGGVASNPVGATGIFVNGNPGSAPPAAYNAPPYLGRQVPLVSGGTAVEYLSVGQELVQGAVILEW